MVYKIKSREICSWCGRKVLRDNKGEHIVIIDDKNYCSCENID